MAEELVRYEGTSCAGRMKPISFFRVSILDVQVFKADPVKRAASSLRPTTRWQKR
jgi:hypothetical protein